MSPLWSFYSIFKEQIDGFARHPRVGNNSLISFTKGIPYIEKPLDVVTAFPTPEQFYFIHKQGTYEIVGLGAALILTGSHKGALLSKLSPLWDRDGQLLLVGGLSFFESPSPCVEWQLFKAYRFTLPLIVIRNTKTTTQITLNYYHEPGVSSQQMISELTHKLNALDHIHIHNRLPAVSPPNSVIRKAFIPDRQQWKTIIKTALSDISTDNISKMVLSRKHLITHGDNVDPYRVLTTLAKAKELSYLFFYKIQSVTAFLGRSPEKLFDIRNGKITTEAIAGTRPRGKNRAEDLKWEKELFQSSKELEEHRIVSRYIRQKMISLCGAVEEDAETVLKLENLQHICTRFAGTTATSITPVDIIDRLHPSPAVGGYPPQATLDRIQAYEPFQRGWYAGPIGWMNKHEAEFVVGIRSALIQGNQMHIFAGSGIVGQSDATAEWQETEYKMKLFATLH